MKFIEPMLEEFCRQGYRRLFMPGHKGTGGYGHDVTETYGTDDLAMPTGAILRANERIAKVYGVDYATMATCGSTACIHAMLMCAKGKLLFGRDAHKSAINGIYMLGLDSEPVNDVSTNGYLEAIQNTKANTLYFTYPNYYGNGIDADAVIETAKAKGMVVIADCAHGAHFIGRNGLPKLPEADMLCVSTHKTLGALTGGAVLMGKREYANELQEAFLCVHSTSPSYLIMESIDNAYAFVEDNPAILERWVDECLKAKEVLGAKSTLDPTRIVLSAEGCSGYELYDILKGKGFLGEMADLEQVVLLTSPYDLETVERLANLKLPKGSGAVRDYGVPYGEAGLSVCQTRGKKSGYVDYRQAEGLMSATAIGAYPPGVATVLPGEIITKEVIDYIGRIFSYGGKMFGMDNERIKVIEQ